jgi:hypothetical protein
MGNGDIHTYILRVHIKDTQGISQFALRSEHKDTSHMRWDESHSRSELGGEKKTPISCRTSHLGFPARIQNILGSWGHFIYPLLTL